MAVKDLIKETQLVQADNESRDPGYDAFIMNDVYPEASTLFTSRLLPVEEIKDDCIFVLDTSALLVPYGTSPDSLEEVRNTYRKLISENRLVVPGQVAREFVKNRPEKLKQLYQQFNRKLSQAKGPQRGRYPLLEPLQEYQNVVRIERDLALLVSEYGEALREVRDRIGAWIWDDPVSLLYSELLRGDVILDPPLDRDELLGELRRRYLHKIPPGYKDSGKQDEGIGDLLIWHTILEVGRERQKSVVFVSGEEKADWHYRSDNTPLYPRYELVDEFRRHSEGQSFHIIKFSDLLGLFGASPAVVSEVREEEKETRTPWWARAGTAAERGVYEWIQEQIFEDVMISRPGFPDLVVSNYVDTVTGYEVKTIGHPNQVQAIAQRSIESGLDLIVSGDLTQFFLVLVVDEALVDEVQDRVAHLRHFIPERITVVVGTLETRSMKGRGEYLIFVPTYEVSGGGKDMGTEAARVSTELRQVLWACYEYWQGESLPPDERTICYSWVTGPYERRFGDTFHQSRLRQLADLGFLEQADVARGGNRRYYKIVDPDRVASLLGEWDLT